MVFDETAEVSNIVGGIIILENGISTMVAYIIMNSCSNLKCRRLRNLNI